MSAAVAGSVRKVGEAVGPQVESLGDDLRIDSGDRRPYVGGCLIQGKLNRGVAGIEHFLFVSR